MEKDLSKIKAAFELLNERWDMGSFEGRFVIQKVTYLLKILGMDINYRFSLYIKGPYSTQLASDYYDPKIIVENAMLTDKEKEIVNKLFTEISNVLVSRDLELLEALVTASYIIKEQGVLSNDELFERIKKLKPYLSDTKVIVGINSAKELLFESNLVSEKTVKEIESWDKMDG